MSVLKNLKSLFIIEESDDASSTSKSKPAATTKPTSRASASQGKQRAAVTSGSTSRKGSRPDSPKGTPDEKFVSVLLEAMEANNLEGFDYLEFKLSVQSLADLPMDDATRFQSAYAMAKTMGATPSKIKETAQHYMKVLSKEERKFEAALDMQIQEKVEAGEAAVKGMEATALEKTQQIAALQAEIQRLNADIAAKQAEIASSKGKIQDTKAQFEAAYQHILGQIESDMEKVDRFLLGGDKQGTGTAQKK